MSAAAPAVFLSLVLVPRLVIAQESDADRPSSGVSEPADSAMPKVEASSGSSKVDPQPVNVIRVNGGERERPPTGEAVVLDTIYVTADKRETAQRDIPGSIGAIRGDKLEKMGAQGMKDYMKLIPGVIYIDRGNEEGIPVIRGISTAIRQADIATTAGVYLDDMPFADLFGAGSFPDLNPFDLERVEVLKGPQGTLFGSGALAGAVRYIVQKPEHGVWQGKLSGTFAQTRMGGLSPVAAGALNIPLFGDTMAVRGVGVYRDDAGVYDESAHDASGNTLRDDENADRLKQSSWRALASWKATDELRVSGFYFDQKTNTGGFGLSNHAGKALFDEAPFPTPRDHDFGGGNLLATYDLDWARVLSSSNRMTKHNYQVLHAEYTADQGNQNQGEGVSVLGLDVSGYTQEFRVSSPDAGDPGDWKWLVGASFLHYRQAFWQYAYIGPDKPDPTSPDQVSEADKAAAQVFGTAAPVAEETALFGEATRRLGPHWEVTAGARQYATTLEGGGEVCGAQVVAFFGTTCRTDHLADSAQGLNPKFSIRYLHNRNVQAYVLAAKGFQFGGFQLNGPAAGFAEAAEREGYKFAPYKSSVLWNYELGLRTEWLDRRLRFDAGLFYLDWRQLQLSVRVPLLPGQPSQSFALIANVGRAHSEGLEAALEAIPFAGANWTSSAAWISAVTDVLFDEDNEDGGVPAGTRLPGSPRFQWSNVFAYEHSLSYFAHWTGGVNVIHTHLGTAPDALRATGEIGGFDTLDTRLSFTRPDSRFLPDISVGVNNVTDVRGVTFHQRIIGTADDDTDLFRFVTPRTTVLTVSWRY